MGVVPGPVRVAAVQAAVGKGDQPRLALAAGIGRGGAAVQNAVDVEGDGDVGADGDADIDPLGLIAGCGIGRGTLHAGIAMGDGVIAAGACRGLDLGHQRGVGSIQLQETRVRPRGFSACLLRGSGQFLHRPEQDYPVATVAEFCTAVLRRPDVRSLRTRIR